MRKDFHPLVKLAIDRATTGTLLRVTRNADTQEASAMHGCTRAIAHNMVQGVHAGFERRLLMMDVGYRATVQDSDVTELKSDLSALQREIVLWVGYRHPVVVQLPNDIEARVEKNQLIILSGVDNEHLGTLAATIRAVRPPYRYKFKGKEAKGIKYEGEELNLKPIVKK